MFFKYNHETSAAISPMLANLTGVCYWWGWVATMRAYGAVIGPRDQPVVFPLLPGIATRIVLFFTAVN